MKISPLGKVPLLIVRQDDGSEAIIFESAVICEYHRGDAARAQPSSGRSARTRAASRLDGVRLSHPRRSLGSWRPRRTPKPSKRSARRWPKNSHASRRRSATGRSSPASASRLVDAVFAPIFRYFDVFEEIGMPSCFRSDAESRARGGRPWRARPSVVGRRRSPTIPIVCATSSRGYDAHLLKLAA